MNKLSINALVAASITFSAGSALAKDGEYYSGINPTNAAVDTTYTGSINSDQPRAGDVSAMPVERADRGDYYKGVSR